MVVALTAVSSTAAHADPGAVPVAPTAVSAVAGYQGVELTWTVGSNGGATITEFAVTTYVNSVEQSTVDVAAASSDSIPDTDPRAGAVDNDTVALGSGGTGYTFTVAAVNSNGSGPDSTPSNAVNPSNTPTDPYPPLFPTATAGSDAVVVLQWANQSDNGSEVTGWVVTPYLGTAAQPAIDVAAGAPGSALDPTLTGDAAQLDGTVDGLTPGVSYAFTVAAVNGVGTGPPSVQSNSAVVPPAGLPALLVSGPQNLQFGDTTLGDYTGPLDITLVNEGNASDTISGVRINGADPDDFFAVNQCGTIAIGQTCDIEVGFLPGALGLRTATLTPIDQSSDPPTIPLYGNGTEGYYEASATGRVDSFGDAGYYGDASQLHLTRPIVGMAATGDDGGYWLVASDGGIFSFGDAQFYGSTGNLRLNKPIVGMAVTADRAGYWLVASDGGIFSFGDAQFYGSTGNLRLNQPIVGMAVTPDGGGYWLVASDGGIFSFGDAQFYGSAGSIHLNEPIVGMAPTPDGGGYWLVASDGGIFSFGDAQFYGSAGAIRLSKPIVGMAPTPDGLGYWLVASDGGIFSYGDAGFYGSDGGQGITNMVSLVGDGPPTAQAATDSAALRMRR